ncbi:protein of unknown function DUF1990 [Macleaya cordata]|uniref:DUF1990 domain-containing protein n=1 Tax=Macleaya cordata TaxID=56857 RepID=A0A200QZV8_MACCD|nr:protein of unknown function DUF1990 [Macleaya cordata]
MVFLCWRRPNSQDQKACIDKSGGSFNYESKYRGASANSLSSLQKDDELLKDGFFLNHSRILVGSGSNTYEKSKTALLTWRHFGLNWSFVDPKTPIEAGAKFCVCVKEVLPWLVMPLQVAYVSENRNPKKLKASFGFGSGTLQGHLLYILSQHLEMRPYMNFHLKINLLVTPLRGEAYMTFDRTPSAPHFSPPRAPPQFSLGKNASQSNWMRTTKFGMKSFPSQNLLTFCHLLDTLMYS